MRKKLLVVFLLFLSSCGNKPRLPIIETKSIDYANGFNMLSFTLAENGAYFLDSYNNILYFYNEETMSYVKLASTFYIDDKVAQRGESIFKYYSESLSDQEIIFYGDHIYGIYSKQSSDGSFSYSMKRLDSKGNNREDLISFDDFPRKFSIDSGKVYVLFGTTDEYLIVYDENFNKIETIHNTDNRDIYGFFVDEGVLKIPETYNIIDERDNIKIEYFITDGPSPGNSSGVSRSLCKLPSSL